MMTFGIIFAILLVCGFGIERSSFPIAFGIVVGIASIPAYGWSCFGVALFVFIVTMVLFTKELAIAAGLGAVLGGVLKGK